MTEKALDRFHPCQGINRLLNRVRVQWRKKTVFAACTLWGPTVLGNGCTQLEFNESTECLGGLLRDCVEN